MATDRTYRLIRRDLIDATAVVFEKTDKSSIKAGTRS